MNKRFSLGRVLTDAGGLIAARWPMLVITMVAMGAILATSDLAIAKMGIPELPQARWNPFGTSATILIRTVVDAALLGLMLGALLAPGDIHSAAGRREPFRVAVVRFPAILLSQLLYILPVLVMAVIAGLMVRSAMHSGSSLEGVALRTALLSNVGWLAALMVLAVVSMAPPAAIAEGLGARAALRRSVELTRKHGPLLFGLYLAVLLLVGAAVLLAVFSGGVDLQALPDWIRYFTAPLYGALKALVFAALFLELRRITTPADVVEAPAETA